MNKLNEGEYFGRHYLKSNLEGLIISDTEYTHEYVDWHHHENPYFTLLLEGKLMEENKKASYQMTSGSLLFHNWQDAHRNFKPNVFIRGAHVEITNDWFERFDINVINLIDGSIHIRNPRIKNLLFQILIELRKNDAYCEASIHLLMMDILCSLKEEIEFINSKKPDWTEKLEELIYENADKGISLDHVSQEIGIHPVHLSRTFHKYYRMTFGNFCREIRLTKVITSILSKKHSMADITYSNSFFDQSHMIASFKKQFNITPRRFKLLMG